MAETSKTARQRLAARVLGILVLVLAVTGYRAYSEYSSYQEALVHHDLAAKAMEDGDWVAADKHLTDVVTVYPYMPAAWEELATAKEVQLLYPESAEVLRQATVHLPDSSRLHLLHSIVLLKVGNVEDALVAARRVQELDPGEGQSLQILRSPQKLANHFHRRLEEEREREIASAKGLEPEQTDHSGHSHSHSH